MEPEESKIADILEILEKFKQLSRLLSDLTSGLEAKGMIDVAKLVRRSSELVDDAYDRFEVGR